MPTVIGSTVTHYRVLDRLGGGGMGVVYKAEDARLRRFVALKFLPPELTDDPVSRERFVQEAQAAGSLDHPNICTIHEIDQTPEGRVFICMAYVDGESLRARLARGPAGAEEAVSIAVQAAAGLAQAHAHGVVHRDVKPANLMLTRDGVVKIVDFGLASLAGRAHLTRTGQVVGTAAYMSPEQARGLAADGRSDVWSLGVVIYEMLTGRRPFDADSDAAILHAIVYDEIRPLAELRPDAPPALVACVARCLVKDPTGRYQSAAELLADLEPVRRALGVASAPTVLERGDSPKVSGGRRIAARLRTPAVALPAALAVLAAALLAATPAGRRAVRAALGVPAVPARQHIAVLPFANVGRDPANRAFCDGLTEVLASTLTQIERFRSALWVVPTSEVRAREVRSTSDARKVFAANLALTGGVQRTGDRVRLALNLVDTADSRQLRSAVVEGSGADLSSLEDRVVAAMSEMLDLQLEPGERKQLATGGTAVAAAYDLYVQGLGALGGYQGERDPEAAADRFRKAVALDPGFALAHAGLSRACLEIYFWKKDAHLVEEAAASARRAAELNDRLGEVHVTLGEIYRTTGKYEDAVREFDRALELDPRSGAAYSGLAQALDTLGRTGDAEATYARAAALRPDDWLTYHRLGAFYQRHGRYQDAERQFRKVVALTPENVWGYNSLAVLFFTLGRYQEAREMFQRAISIRPSAALYSNLGTLAFVQRDWAEAVRDLERACEGDALDYVPRGNLGIAYHWLGGHEEESRRALAAAVALAERQLAVNPLDTSVLGDLASYHALLGEKDRALACLRRVESAGRESPDLAIQIADVYTDLGLPDEAIPWIGTGLRLGFPAAQLANLPALDGVVKDPRVQEMLRALGAAPARVPK